MQLITLKVENITEFVLNNKMLNKNKLGTLYEFCSKCDSCPVAIEAEVSGMPGLEIKDDFGGAVKLTDENLKDLAIFLNKRYKI